MDVQYSQIRRPLAMRTLPRTTPMVRHRRRSRRTRVRPKRRHRRPFPTRRWTCSHLKVSQNRLLRCIVIRCIDPKLSLGAQGLLQVAEFCYPGDTNHRLVPQSPRDYPQKSHLRTTRLGKILRTQKSHLRTTRLGKIFQVRVLGHPFLGLLLGVAAQRNYCAAPACRQRR